MRYTHNKKSPHAHSLAAEHEGTGQKTGLLKYIFIPARRGTTSCGPFSFQIVTQARGYDNEI
jgi:hypothetical protein